MAALQALPVPFFRTHGRLIYFAHVPKCGGSAVTDYLQDRFGNVAFLDNRYMQRPEASRWTRTSPQHVDALTLDRYVPLGMFDAAFTVIRHPVPRLVSVYHFHKEVERSLPPGVGFSQWLEEIDATFGEEPFKLDNHVLPMSRIVPEGATVFHLEHGLDPLIIWLDLVAGRTDGPRAMLPENRRGDHVRVTAAKAEPTEADLARIARLYAEDFARFGYAIGSLQPLAAPPAVTPEFIAERDRALAAATRPMARLRRKMRRRIDRL